MRLNGVVSTKSPRVLPGDLITIVEKKFPTTLRKGPGYTHLRVELMEPGEIGIVLESCVGHSALLWVLLVGPGGKTGWIPESMVDPVKY